MIERVWAREYTPFSLGGHVESHVARQASPTREFRLVVQKQSFSFPWDSTWPPSEKGLLYFTVMENSWKSKRGIRSRACINFADTVERIAQSISGGGGSKQAKYEAKLERGRGVQNKKPSVGGVWIFSRTAKE